MPSSPSNLQGPKPTALLAGATGLVGQALLRQLARDPHVGAIKALVRRPPQGIDAARVQACMADFDRLAEQAAAHPDWFTADWVFCALGTTIKKAGSQEAFRRVDHDYPLALAKLARAQGARHFLLVSALGADARSRVFYSRVKGELEQALRALGFESLTIAQPSFLDGPRQEFRLGERLALPLARLVPGAWKPVHVDHVAAALIAAAHRGAPGAQVLSNKALRASTLPR